MGGAENIEQCGVKTTRRRHFKTGSCADDVTGNSHFVNMVEGDTRVKKARSFASVARLCLDKVLPGQGHSVLGDQRLLTSHLWICLAAISARKSQKLGKIRREPARKA